MAYKAFTGQDCAATPSNEAYMMWLFIWCLYPLLKGVWHIVRWDGERKRKEDLNPRFKHPYAVAAARIGTAAAVHSAKKSDSPKA